MNNKELIEYLQQFPDNARPSVLIANPKARLIYESLQVDFITDADVPVCCITVGDAEAMDEEMVGTCEEEERGVENE